MYVDSDAVPSPPLSPTHGNEEASQIGSILESVCNAKDVSSAAIAKLCDHVKADPQEQQVALNVLITGVASFRRANRVEALLSFMLFLVGPGVQSCMGVSMEMSPFSSTILTPI